MAQDIIHYDPCCKIDAADIDAYFNLYLDEENLSHLWYDTPWGKDFVDLKPALEAAMVAGRLELYPEDNPTSLRYVKGGAYDDILGQDLSRIVWMQYLKDTDQSKKPADGEVYMFNATTELFELFNLTSVLADFDARIKALDARVTALEINYQGFEDTLAGIESTLDDFEARIKALEEGGVTPGPEPEPEPEPEIAPYGFLIYNDNGTDKYYQLASEADFQKLGTTSFTQNTPISFEGLTVNSEDFRGYDFVDYEPTALPDTFMSRATLKYPLNIPDSVANIGEDFLAGATINTTIKLPSGLTEIPGSFLYYATINAAITLPNTVTSIGEQFLGYCEYRYSQPVALPTSLKTIGDSFMSRVLGPGRTYGYPFDVIIPEGVNSIGNGFLRYLLTGSVVEAPKPPTKVVIPSTVNHIGWSFMDNCTNALTVEVNTTTVPAPDEEGVANLWTLAMTTGSATQGNNLPAWTTGITLTGAGASAWAEAFPNLDGKANKVDSTTYYMRRKLIDSTAPEPPTPPAKTLAGLKAALNNGTAQTDYPIGTEIEDTVSGRLGDHTLIVGTYRTMGGKQAVGLFRKYSFTWSQFNTTADDISYPNSKILSELNGTYLSQCSQELRDVISEVSVPWYNGSSIQQVSAKWHLFSGRELGLTYNPGEGEMWEYWKQQTGLSSPSDEENSGRIIRDYNYKEAQGTTTRSNRAILHPQSERGIVKCLSSGAAGYDIANASRQYFAPCFYIVKDSEPTPPTPAAKTLSGLKRSMADGEAEEEYPVGTEIEDTYDGVSNPLIVAQYLDSTNNSSYGGAEGCILVRKYCAPTRAYFDSDRKPDYTTSDVKELLDGEYLNKCSSDLRSVISEISVPYYNGTSMVPVQSKWFLMSYTEVYSKSYNEGVGDEGIAWDYWKQKTGLSAPSELYASNTGRVMQDTAGQTRSWWLRSFAFSYVIGYVNTTGQGSTFGPDNSDCAVLPACFISRHTGV